MIDHEHYVIWSNEHRGWWRPGRNGYTSKLSEAGHYTRLEALAICSDALPGNGLRLGMMPEIPVRFADADMVRNSFRDAFPNVPLEDWE